MGVELNLMGANTSFALPPPTDIPEEILRMEIIPEARSPLDGQPLNAKEYAELAKKLAQSPFAPEISPKIRQLIFLLQVRKLLKTLTPL